MAIQLSTEVRNARLDQLEVVVGSTSPKLHIVTTTGPANCASTDTGVVIAILALPDDWLNAASSGTKTLAGTWQVSATGTGTAAHFRLYNSGTTICHMQGTVGQGTGDLSLDNTSITASQTVTITAFTLTDGNA